MSGGLRNATCQNAKRRSATLGIRAQYGRRGPVMSRTPHRVLRCETLESRRLMVAEGDLFSVTETLDVSGLLGDVSVEVRWGDGTSSPATVRGGNEVGNLRVRIDYSFDTNNFFADESRRDLLQIAADSLVSRFADDLSAITPSDLNQWTASIFHPSSGSPNQLQGTRTMLEANPVVVENEIVIYAGARDLPGNTRGVGGGAARTSTTIGDFTPTSQEEADRVVAEFEAFQDSVRSRGEPGALETPATDFAPHFGSISFDNADTDWYFGLDPSGLGVGQVDFISVATHEVAHAFGFGTSQSWTALTSTGQYTGERANEVYRGTGSIPLEAGHWAQSVLSVQPTLMAPSLRLIAGQRPLFSELDFAGMDDLGWDLVDTRTIASADHRYVDDGDFPLEVVLKGATAGEKFVPIQNVNVTNVAPTLVVPGDRTISLGQTLSINELGMITDPGSMNAFSDPLTFETFDYTVDWGDGSGVVSGSATISSDGDRQGNPTVASFGSSHQYDMAGRMTVIVTVTDDDGGQAQERFNVIVNNPAIQVVASPGAPAGGEDPDDLPTGPQPTSWSTQRSDLREIVISLANPITEVTTDGVILVNLGVDASEDDVVVQLLPDHLVLGADGRTLTIRFDQNELADGIYQITLLGGVTGGAPLTIRGDETNKLFKLTGDWNGSGAVNIQDFATFAYWFASEESPEYVDLNGSGGVNIQDFAGFATNFGNGITFPTSGVVSLGAGEGELLVSPTLQLSLRDASEISEESLVLLAGGRPELVASFGRNAAMGGYVNTGARMNISIGVGMDSANDEIFTRDDAIRQLLPSLRLLSLV